MDLIKQLNYLKNHYPMLNLLKKKRLITKFMDHIAKDTKEVVFGLKDTMRCILAG